MFSLYTESKGNLGRIRIMLRKGKVKRIAIGVAAAMIAAAPLYASSTTAFAASTPKVTSVTSVVKPIYISGKSYFNLVDVALKPTDGGQIATFTLSIYNGEAKELDLSDYWFRLSSASGSTYPIKTSAADANKTKVSPYSKTFITLYATVGQSTKLSDLIFRLVKFDFSSYSSNNYEKTVGSYKFPTNYTNVVASGSYKVLYFSNTQVNTKVLSATIGASGDDNLATINFVYNNVGKNAVTLSKYKYYIQTAEGIMYEATPEETEDLVIAPLKREEVKLTANIPASLKTTGWKLIVAKDNGGETALELPVGAYQLSFGGSTGSTTASNQFTYTNTQGSYQVSLLQIVRQPWESQDVLTARIRIQNKGTETAALPNLAGYFYLDDKVQLDFKTIAISNQLGLNANGYVDIDVYAKLPTNYTLNSVKLVVNNKVDEQTSTKIGELTNASAIAQIPVYGSEQAYAIAREGSAMSGTVDSVNIYKSTTTKLYTTQVTLTNNESRTIDPVKLVGFFKNTNGDIFPAAISTGEGKVNPKNKALLNFSASIPLDYDTSSLQLIVGEAVTDTNYTTGTNTADGYVNAVAIRLPQDQGVNTTYKDVSLAPYKLTINEITPQVFAQASGQEVKLVLNYDLIKDTTYNVFATDRKLLLTVEGTDPNDGAVYTYFSKEIALEGEADSFAAGTDLTATFGATSEYNGIDGTLNYNVRLYEVVNGAKKLVADRPLDYWYIEQTWNTEEAGS
ncbi:MULTISPECIES: hypothetical protein [Cohnella]|uniref:hypothetical protein n=1 Tax=Cohnella TaxID=329857 RepID=UPI0011188338|nr:MULTISPECIES: hypothetical protein [Cohnella]MBN2980687.1 hypothetical protein [Cohnella algarum]